VRDSRTELEAFRVSPSERREVSLLAAVRGVTKSALLRALVREAAENETKPSVVTRPTDPIAPETD